MFISWFTVNEVWGNFVQNFGRLKWQICLDFNNTRRIDDIDIAFKPTGKDFVEERKGFDILGQPSSYIQK